MSASFSTIRLAAADLREAPPGPEPGGCRCLGGASSADLGLAWDGESLWAVDYESHDLYRLDLEQFYYPNRIFAGAEEASELPVLQQRFTGETTIYVCEGNTCRLPVKEVAAAAAQIGQG